ncbi:hypothetical protein D3C76_1634610 [compost metagenome]
MLTNALNLSLIMSRAKDKSIRLLRSRFQFYSVLQYSHWCLITSISTSKYLRLKSRRIMKSAFAFKALMIYFPRGRLVICKQIGFVAVIFDFAIILIFLIRRNCRADNALQIFHI